MIRTYEGSAEQLYFQIPVRAAVARIAFSRNRIAN
ncbi:hypothetical protein X962_4161 [Burkholderia pseudomallei MSHR7343]|nr:hypothetical protein BPC006_I3212 [Burkholderia pseudomallei BPC006]KGR96268.1 hypothetical protein X948_4778 [Burkholderia pseudomallei MSHR5608]KGS24344.1 hypothetical protein X941_5086 [Burkholderia pseudomallei MSHR5569]KGS26715.1 hypothetical protein X962_4161 [Burkholderia pseudomallei MSHR7343]VUD52864.1 unnamed protein product [Burkholderia pseudomallei]